MLGREAYRVSVKGVFPDTVNVTVDISSVCITAYFSCTL